MLKVRLIIAVLVLCAGFRAEALGLGDVQCNTDGSMSYKDGTAVDNKTMRDNNIYCEEQPKNPADPNAPAYSPYQGSDLKCVEQTGSNGKKTHVISNNAGNAMNVPGKTCKTTCVPDEMSDMEICITTVEDTQAESFCSLPEDPKAYRDAWRVCWYCPPFSFVIGKIAGPDGIAKSAFNNLGGLCVTLMALGFAIWLAHYVFTLINPITGMNVGSGWDMARAIGPILFKMMLVAIIIANKGEVIYSYFVVPVIQLAASIAFALNGPDLAETHINTDAGADAFTELYNAMDGFLRGTAYMIMDIMSNGMLLIRFSLAIGTMCIFQAMQPFFTGLVMMVAALILVVQFPLKLINAVMRLAFVSVLMPFALVAWVFPVKLLQGMVTKIVDMIVSIATTFTFAALSVFICRKFLQHFYDGKLDYTSVDNLVSQLNIMVSEYKEGEPQLFQILVVLLVVILIVCNLPAFAKAMAMAKSAVKAGGRAAWSVASTVGQDSGNSMSAAFSGVSDGKNNMNAAAYKLVSNDKGTGIAQEGRQYAGAVADKLTPTSLAEAKANVARVVTSARKFTRRQKTRQRLFEMRAHAAGRAIRRWLRLW